MLDSSDPVAARANDHYVAHVDRHRLIDYSALLRHGLGALAHVGARLLVALGNVDAGDKDRQRPAGSSTPSTGGLMFRSQVSQNLLHLAAFAGILAVQNDDGVAGPDFRNLVDGSALGLSHHSTSGARDTIFI